MKRVLVTGASGFIGRHCLPLLLGGVEEVHAVSARRQIESKEGIKWHTMDLLNPEGLPDLLADLRPDCLLHLAWIATPKVYWTSPDNLRWVEASLHLMREFARCGGRRVVVAGTCAEYDWNYGYCLEGLTPCVPATLYGRCKHALQLMVTAFAAQQGLSAAWGRVFFLYGPYEHPARLVSSVVAALLRGEIAPCTNGEQIRDFLHVADVAGAFVRLLDSGVEGPVNIGSGQAIRIKEVLRIIGEVTGRAELIQLGGLPDDKAPLVLLPATDRLRAEVGWVPRYSLAEGLALTIDWWEESLQVEGGAACHATE